LSHLGPLLQRAQVAQFLQSEKLADCTLIDERRVDPISAFDQAATCGG
jgi:hypothetical protein